MIYPTWNRFVKMWKTIVYPVIKQNVNVYSWDKPSVDEEYEISTKDIIDDTELSSIINQLQNALTSKGYDVSVSDIVDDDDDWDGGSDCDITIHGKDRYDPYICISLFTSELDDDEILHGWDDGRWAERWDGPQDDFGFNLDYSEWIKNHGIVDNYENIFKAPQEVKDSYCDWVRSRDMTRLWIRIEYVE